MKEVDLENLPLENPCFYQGGIVAFMSRNDCHNTNAAIRVADKYVKTSGKQCLYFSLKLERNNFYQLEGNLDYILEDTAGIKLDDMLDEIREVNRMLNIGLVVVDYLPLVVGRDKVTRQEELLDILISLYELAMELNICILIMLITGPAVAADKQCITKKDLQQYNDRAGEFINHLYFVDKDTVKEMSELL